MKSMTTFSSLVSVAPFALSLAALAVVGCASQPDAATEQLATDGAAVVAADDDATLGLTASVFEAVPSADLTVAPLAVASAAPDAGDAGCRTRALDPSDPTTVIVTLHDCTGLFGRRVVSGTGILHFSLGSAGALHMDMHSENLTVDGRPASHTASADITFAAGARTVAWLGAWQGTTAAGEAAAHTSDLTIQVDAATHCRTRSGTAQTTIGTRAVESSIDAVKVCRAAGGEEGCPTGAVVHTRVATGKEITVSFDGSNEADVTDAKGDSFQRALVCSE
jgi:hypothetical protein